LDKITPYFPQKQIFHAVKKDEKHFGTNHKQEAFLILFFVCVSKRYLWSCKKWKMPKDMYLCKGQIFLEHFFPCHKFESKSIRWNSQLLWRGCKTNWKFRQIIVDVSENLNYKKKIHLNSKCPAVSFPLIVFKYILEDFWEETHQVCPHYKSRLTLWRS
jgi:hypothetical protein